MGSFKLKLNPEIFIWEPYTYRGINKTKLTNIFQDGNKKFTGNPKCIRKRVEKIHFTRF